MNAGVGDGDDEERQLGDIAVYERGWVRKRRRRIQKKKKEPRSKMCT